jgi:hypothetical protein
MVRIFRAEAVYFSETSLSTYMASQPWKITSPFSSENLKSHMHQ